MKTRRFSGATMQDALREVKAAFGAEAAIVDTAEVAGLFTVTAAVDLEADGGAAAPADAVGARPAAPDTELAGELRALVGVVRELVHEQRRHHVPALAPELLRLHRALLAQGVDGVIAAALLRETAERLAPGTALDA